MIYEKLYHGTTEPAAVRAWTGGLRPRGQGRGNWEEEMESRPDCVYLTSAYAPYFAWTACAQYEERSAKYVRMAILEIDVKALNERLLLPDEDFLEQATRRDARSQPLEWVDRRTMAKRTRRFRDNLEAYAHHWKDAVQWLGNCAYRGIIPPRALTRAAFVDLRENPTMALMVTDPTITIMNHSFCGDKYRAATRAFFGDHIDPLELYIAAEMLDAETRNTVHQQLDDCLRALKPEVWRRSSVTEERSRNPWIDSNHPLGR